MAKKPPKPPSKGKSKGNGKGRDRWLVPTIVISLVIISLMLWGPLRKFQSPLGKKPSKQASKTEPARKKEEKKEEKESRKDVQKEAGKEVAKEVPQEARQEERNQEDRNKEVKGSQRHDREEVAAPPPSRKTVQIAIVIDDMGQNMKRDREILALPGKLTLSIMPGLASSRKTAELAKRDNREILLHLPMEYRGKNGNPAPGMLLTNMTPDQFLATVNSDIEAVPGAVGINNHEGSALTENKEAMKFLMAGLKDRNLMFLDSLTSPKSVAYATAREFGLKSAKRDVFLDNDSDNPASIRKQLDELAEIARKHGRAIGIGHPHPATISELRKWLAEAESRGIEIVPLSRLMN